MYRASRVTSQGVYSAYAVLDYKSTPSSVLSISCIVPSERASRFQR